MGEIRQALNNFKKEMEVVEFWNEVKASTGFSPPSVHDDEDAS